MEPMVEVGAGPDGPELSVAEEPKYTSSVRGTLMEMQCHGDIFCTSAGSAAYPVCDQHSILLQFVAPVL